MVADLDGDLDLKTLADELPEPEDLLESEDDAPIIRLINALLTEAVKEGASDIHIEPFENRLVVRFRIDGVLREVLAPQKGIANAVVSRIKVMAKLDIAEKRLPQDGRIGLRIAGAAGRRARVDDPCRPRRARRAAPARQAGRQARPGAARHGAGRRCSAWPKRSSARTASCSSPARPARARRPRCTRRCCA